MPISIAGLNRADVLAALYNASRPLGMGFMGYDSKPMDRATAEKLLATQTYFDYLQGRVMKIKLDSDESFEANLYDRDNGAGAAQAAIDALRSSGVNAIEIQAAHEVGKLDAASQAEKGMRQESRLGPEPGVFHLGMADVAEPLGEAIRRATDPDTATRGCPTEADPSEKSKVLL